MTASSPSPASASRGPARPGPGRSPTGTTRGRPGPPAGSRSGSSPGRAPGRRRGLPPARSTRGPRPRCRRGRRRTCPPAPTRPSAAPCRHCPLSRPGSPPTPPRSPAASIRDVHRPQEARVEMTGAARPDGPGREPAAVVSDAGRRPAWVGRPPAYLTPLVGRELEMPALTALLLHPAVRLVTLTGPAASARPGSPPRSRRISHGLRGDRLRPARRGPRPGPGASRSPRPSASGVGDEPVATPWWTSCGPGRSCWCSTTSSRCWRPGRTWPISWPLPAPHGPGDQPRAAAALRRAGPTVPPLALPDPALSLPPAELAGPRRCGSSSSAPAPCPRIRPHRRERRRRRRDLPAAGRAAAGDRAGGGAGDRSPAAALLARLTRRLPC